MVYNSEQKSKDLNKRNITTTSFIPFSKSIYISYVGSPVPSVNMKSNTLFDSATDTNKQEINAPLSITPNTKNNLVSTNNKEEINTIYDQTTNTKNNKNDDKIASLNKCFIESLCKMFNNNKISNFADLFSQYRKFYEETIGDTPKTQEDVFSKLFGTTKTENNATNSDADTKETNIENNAEFSLVNNNQTNIENNFFDKLFNKKNDDKAIFEKKDKIKFEDIFNKKQ